MAKPATGSDGQVSVATWLAAFPPETAVLLRQVRKLAKKVAPGATEQAYRGWSMRLRTDRGTASIRGARGHVTVVFSKGVTLRDPQRLLETSSSGQRSMKLRSVAEASGDALRDLLKQELRTGPTRMPYEKGEGKRIFERVRRICLDLPEVTERLSHGTPTFFFRGNKQFAQVWTAHHGDGRYAVWAAAPLGAQRALVASDPERFFVPPYVGHRGWLGMRLDRGVDAKELRGVLDDAYAVVASSSSHTRVGR